MGPQSLPGEFNSPSRLPRRCPDPLDRPGGCGRPMDALSPGRAPRPVPRPPRAPEEGSSGPSGPEWFSLRRWAGCGDRGSPPERGKRVGCRAIHLGGLLAVLPNRVRLLGPSIPPSQGLRRIGRHPIRPVLKHGPRSLTRARVMGFYET